MKNAVMFPGLGAEYPNMIARFIEHHQGSEKIIFSIIDDGLRQAERLGIKRATAAEAALQSQLEIHALNLAWYRIFAKRDITISLACGHSLGFYAAAVATKAMSAEDSVSVLVFAFCETHRLFLNNEKKVAVLTTFQPMDAQLLSDMNLQVLSINNATQLLLYGLPANYQTLLTQYEDNVLRIDYFSNSLPFHSSEMNTVCASLESYIQDRVFNPPSIPIVSHIRNELITSGESVRWHIYSQLKLPVCWPQVIDYFTDNRISHVYEVGPNRMLSQMMRWMKTSIKAEVVDPYRKEMASSKLLKKVAIG